MSIAQIAAIIGLLMAFGVDQPVVNNVQAILENSNKQIQEVPAMGGVAPAKEEEAWVDIKSNGSDGPVKAEILRVSQGREYSTVNLQWTTKGVSDDCKLTRNEGNGDTTINFLKSNKEVKAGMPSEFGLHHSKIAISCRSDQGPLVKDSIDVNY